MAEPGKTESATPRRREDARKKGQVARSVELNTALGILGSLIVLQLAGSFMTSELSKLSIHAWGNLDRGELLIGDLQKYSITFGVQLALIMAPLLLGVFLVGVLTNVIQVGLHMTPEAITLKPDNLNPVSGFSRIYSRRSAIELFKGFLKVAVVSMVAWFTIKARIEPVMNLMHSDMRQFWLAIADLSGALILRIGLALLAMALLDYLYQKYEFEESIKMSKQEVKDEHKQLEGDPQIKARIRRLQQEASRRRMLAELPTADVVITNPTHLAVALRYDENNADAPRVIAKGARLLAQRIKEIARNNRIPVLENKPLARALYESTPVGATVPSALFDAVAQLLAYVYQMQGRLAEKARKNRERVMKKGGLVLSPLNSDNP